MTMRQIGVTGRISVFSAVLLVAGCASGPGSIYVPVGGGQDAPPPPSTVDEGTSSGQTVWRKSEQSEPSQGADTGGAASSGGDDASPSYRESGDRLSPAALSLVRSADQKLASGDTQGAIGLLERAQRIAPGSAEVYFKLSEAYVSAGQLGTAEQFTLKGLSLAGNDTRLQRSGWLLLADIRRARGNVAGADQAEARASSL